MFKVSFKENPQFPVKKVQRFNDDRVTVVTLKGVTQVPVFLQYYIPRKVFDWTSTLKNVDVEFVMSKMSITVTGKSICSKEDKVDKILGERLAEARAKLKIYKFMRTFCHKMFEYYTLKLYGTKASNNTIVIKVNPEKDSLFKAYMKYDRLIDVENTHIKQLLYDY